jgi:hypothetical protein
MFDFEKKFCYSIYADVIFAWSLAEVGTWGGVQGVPRSAWVKTDAAGKTANATSVFTHAL